MVVSKNKSVALTGVSVGVVVGLVDGAFVGDCFSSFEGKKFAKAVSSK